MKWGPQQGLGVVASRWLMGGKAKAHGVRGYRLPSPPCFVQNLLMLLCLLSRSGRLLANICSLYSYTWIFICFTFIFLSNTYLIYNLFAYLKLSLADTHGYDCYRHTGKEWPNAHTHPYIQKKKRELKSQKETRLNWWKGGQKKRKEGKHKKKEKAKRRDVGNGFRGVEERGYWGG